MGPDEQACAEAWPGAFEHVQWSLAAPTYRLVRSMALLTNMDLCLNGFVESRTWIYVGLGDFAQLCVGCCLSMFFSKVQTSSYISRITFIPQEQGLVVGLRAVRSPELHMYSSSCSCKKPHCSFGGVVDGHGLCWAFEDVLLYEVHQK